MSNVDIRKDVDYLKSTDFSSLLETAHYVDSSEGWKINPSTTEDIYRDESDGENEEVPIEIWEKNIYEDLSNHEYTIV